jgi:DNA-directed RNA polymerase subunit RPC12/RpoP
MKVRCTQCGASLRVLGTDFYLRCPYCEASVVVRETGIMPSIVDPVMDTAGVERLFPPGIVESTAVRFFPYVLREGEEAPVFSQPFDELTGYVPPAGDRKVWDDDLVEPESLIPVSPDLAGEDEAVVYHPFFLVMLRGSGFSSGVLVDGISGRILGDYGPTPENTKPERSRDTALRALAVGIVPSALVFILTHGGSTGMFGGALFSAVAAAAAFVLYVFLTRKRGRGWAGKR